MNSNFRMILGLGLVSLTGCNASADFAAEQRKTYDATAVYKHTFAVSQLVDGSKEMTEGGRYEHADVTLKEKPVTTSPYMQIDRNFQTASKKQGHDSRKSVEEFDIATAGMLDLLVVIDDSKSMEQEKANLSTKLEPLLSAVKDTSWQIAVISMSNPCVTTANLVKKSDINISSKFEKAVNKNVDKEALELGFPMAIQSLQGQCNGALKPKWIRDGSSVGVLVVSDEDNCGGSADGEIERCNDKYGKNADEMLEFLYHIRSPEMARMYALVKQSPDTCQNAPVVGTEYMKAVVASGGVSGSICAADYSDSLKRISTNVANIIRREFKLSNIPDLSEFKVEADGVVIPQKDAWTLTGTKVSINPDAFKTAKKVKFSYTHDAVEKFDSIKVSGKVLENSMVVKFNGVVQSGGYVYSADEEEISFSPMPPDDAVIDLKWREDKPLTTKFKILEAGVRENTVEVYVNGALVPKSAYEFKKDSQIVEFVTPPVDAAVIAIRFRTEGHRVLKYDIAISRVPVATKIVDKVSGEEIKANIVGKSLVVDASEILDGRKVSVDVDFGSKPLTNEMELPETALPDTLTVKVNGSESSCTVAEENAATEETGLAFNLLLGTSKVKISCPAENPDHSTIQVAYKYEIDRTNEFKIPDAVPLGDASRPTGYKVLINGTETKNFKRLDRTFTLEESELSPGAKVEIFSTTYQKVE